ncbi:MAG: DUF962 domain-containing protein [Chitinophagales bacterium]|nr:DUF962 domain-containing protein [Chitinophagales bacterium]MDW8418408.1 DUF962 domain-containing protein [Chitinophagales bacterium]
MKNEQRYTKFWDFYPYYLTEHARPANRAMHFIGTALVIVCAVLAPVLQRYYLLLLIPLLGYGFAWIGHFFLERNKPATFQYPLYSLGSDFVMFWHILTGQITDKVREAHRKLGITNPWE